MTSRAGAPARSPSDTMLPSTLGKEKSGALVPSGNMVLGVKTMANLLKKASHKTRSYAYLNNPHRGANPRGTSVGRVTRSRAFAANRQTAPQSLGVLP